MQGRDEKIFGVVIKRQPVGEADVLVTWFTRELGKIRTMVASAAKPSSKLAFGLLPGAEVCLRVVGKGFGSSYRLAGVSTSRQLVKKYDETRLVLLFWLMEVVQKGTADEEVNVGLYEKLCLAMEVLDSNEFNDGYSSLWQFLVGKELVGELGWPLEFSEHNSEVLEFFSGRFFSSTKNLGMYKEKVFSILPFGLTGMYKNMSHASVDIELALAMDRYLSYHLERKINAKMVGDVIMQSR